MGGRRGLAGGYDLDWSGLGPLDCCRIGNLTYGLDHGYDIIA